MCLWFYFSHLLLPWPFQVSVLHRFCLFVFLFAADPCRWYFRGLSASAAGFSTPFRWASVLLLWSIAQTTILCGKTCRNMSLVFRLLWRQDTIYIYKWMHCYFHHCKYDLLLELILVIMKWLASLRLPRFLIKSERTSLPRMSLCMRIKCCCFECPFLVYQVDSFNSLIMLCVHLYFLLESKTSLPNSSSILQ